MRFMNHECGNYVNDLLLTHTWKNMPCVLEDGGVGWWGFYLESSSEQYG